MAFPVNRTLLILNQTPVLLQALLRDVDQTRASQARDGDGWNVVEIMCHLNDFEQIFTDRLYSLCVENPPFLTSYDPDQLAAERHYADQALAATLAQWLERRHVLIAYLKNLPQEDWQRRSGMHPALGPLSLLELALVVALHDVNHIEQMTRALGLAERF